MLALTIASLSKPVLVGIVAAAIFYGGWHVRGWKEDSENLAVERAAQAITAKAIERESGIAEKVEQTLAGLKANQTVIDRGVIRETQNTVYRNVCIPESGRVLVNSAARGEAVPAEPSGEVSGGAAGTR